MKVSFRASGNLPVFNGNSTVPKSHRSHGSLNLGSIFGRTSRPGSPVLDEGRPESPHSNGRERGREKNNENVTVYFRAILLGGGEKVLGR
jgi:hypothetical protein